MSVVRPMSESQWRTLRFPDFPDRSGYVSYRAGILHSFRMAFPPRNRIFYNYTMGFGDQQEAWCNELDGTNWMLVQNYGSLWPLGFSKPEYAFAFKMRWL